jgi:hypothetical protein
MNEYPFELWIYAVVSGGVKDAFGFETGTVCDWVKHSDCYEQVIGQGVIFHKENGDSFAYSSKIFLPEGTGKVEDGTRIQVRQDGSVRFEGVSERFSRDIEHCRLWA